MYALRVKQFAVGLGLAGALVSAQAAMVYDFLHNPNGNTPNTWGTMTIDVVSASQVSIRFDTKDPGTPVGTVVGHEATGFGFAFAGVDYDGLTVANPGAADLAYDDDSLTWVKLANLNSIPNPANSVLDKDAFFFGATEGNANNYSPPGVAVGDSDVFYIGGFTGLTSENLAEFIEVVGVRFQSITGVGTGGAAVTSLFLVGSDGGGGGGGGGSVPEPAPIALMGLAFAGMAMLRRRNKAAKAA